MADVFISYARENQAFAQRIAESVSREGYSVWWDDDLPPHLSYGDVITEKIGGAKAAIVVWSREAAQSEWVRAEADVARVQKKLIQTSIDGGHPPMPFNQIQFASIGDWKGERDHPGWRKVRASLAALCSESAPATERTAGHATPPAAAPAAAPSARGSWRLPALLAGLAALVALLGGWFWLGGGKGVEPEARAPGPVAVGPAPSPSVIAPSPQPATAQFTHAAVIDDPDGFTNVRSGPAVGFPVIARINDREVFTTYPQERDWWQVRTAGSRVGFMERSRIRLIEPETARTPEGPAASGGGLLQGDATLAADSGPGQIFADSSHRLLTDAELAALSRAEARLARNEIFARHGRPFRDPALRRHFARFPWYSPRPGPIALNGVEQANVRLLQEAEAK